MSLQMGYTDRREVRQFQYTAWPDHGVPDYPGLFTFFNSHLHYINTFHQKIYFLTFYDHFPGPFLQFLRRINTMNPTDAGPSITHCRFVYIFINNVWFLFNFQLFVYIFSAGVGRTGAFIVIDSMLERIKHEKTIDVYGHVTCLRSQRNYMVCLYNFYHLCLFTFLI